VGKCLTVTIQRCTERGSHGYKPHTLKYPNTVPDRKVVCLGPHHGRSPVGDGSILNHFAMRFRLLRHGDESGRECQVLRAFQIVVVGVLEEVQQS
jgi:hypothetical protein